MAGLWIFRDEVTFDAFGKEQGVRAVYERERVATAYSLALRLYRRYDAVADVTTAARPEAPNVRRRRENFRCNATSMGVQSQLGTLAQIIKAIDPKLHQHLGIGN
ncbi:OLC1v1015837C1 [Oldenlandia corymbosa var. corymbosa]|uniref:OLC1v1015837C1 n=1 Tax=Oldenlandia corymbosa var. corymbosa TaxID=529605 RepID=A0AAV1E4H6_OLDCO|nr:OLC1v1015837C1 [Oldenlandia corymbosa var. corymbosa]